MAPTSIAALASGPSNPLEVPDTQDTQAAQDTIAGTNAPARQPPPLAPQTDDVRHGARPDAAPSGASDSAAGSTDFGTLITEFGADRQMVLGAFDEAGQEPTVLAASATAAAPLQAQAELPVGSLNQLAAYLTDGYWDQSLRSRHSFDTSDSNVITVNFDALGSAGVDLARQALEAWEMVADLSFVEVTGAGGDITFDDKLGGAYADYDNTGSTTTSATVNVSVGWLAIYGTTLDAYAFSTFVHEIGHALGLGHQGPYNGAATYPDDAAYANDSWHLSVMSYFSMDDNTQEDADFAWITSAMMADIIAIQDLYGAPVDSVTAGATIYGYGTNLDNVMGDLFRAQWETPDPAVYNAGEPVTYTIWDESGIDTIDFSPDTHNQVFNLGPTSANTVDGVFESVIIARGTVIENYIAGHGNDLINGNSSANSIRGGDGHDTIYGGSGADRLRGNAQGDELLGLTGGDSLYGGNAHDTVSGNDGNDLLFGGAGNDSLYGGLAQDKVHGGDGDDLLWGQDGGDTLRGDAGDDIIFGHVGNDLVQGGDGDDDINGGQGFDTLYSGNGHDTIIGLQGDDKIGGGAGDDMLIGSGGNDTLKGGGGDDTLNGGTGADHFIFGAGQDRILQFQNDLDTLVIDSTILADGVDTVQDVLDLAMVSGGELVIDFGGGNVLSIENFGNINALSNDIFIA